MTFSKCTKGLYKINKNSINGFLTNKEIFLSLWQLHDNGSLSYTPFHSWSPKNSEGFLVLKIMFSMTKYLIKHLVVNFLPSVSTLKNSSEIYVKKSRYN